MDKETKATLLKQFSIILRNRSKDAKYPKLSQSLVEYYSRKDLIDILKKKHDGKVPSELNLMECENSELLKLIGDDMFLISYSTEQWSKDTQVNNTSVPQVQKITPVAEKKTSTPDPKNPVKDEQKPNSQINKEEKKDK
ncbi:MAG: hypothetical protein JNL75_06055 [Chitinophagales bacterium]|nr:hypothetical protein [Chitinophagales bacterium]